MLVEDRLLKAVFESSLDAIIIIDDQKTIRLISRSAREVFGYTSEELIGQNVKILMPSFYARHHDGYIDRYAETGERHIIGRQRVVNGQRKDGTVFPMELSVGETNGEGGKFFTGFIRDLTEYRETERYLYQLQGQILQASIATGLGEMSAMFAHEANQPLSAAGTYLQVAREVFGSQQSSENVLGMKMLDHVDSQIKRLSEIVKTIRSQVSRTAPIPEPADVNQLIEEAVGISTIGNGSKDISTSLRLSPANPLASIDKLQIQQVILHLIQNGIASTREQPRREILVQSRLDEGGMIEVSVCDTGVGIPAEDARDLFKPFVKKQVHGVGLGLTICRSIVEAHGGQLWFEPNPEGGTVFKFTLPVFSDHILLPNQHE